MAKGNKNKGKQKGESLADKANKHLLYEASVQCVESEIDFVDETFRKIRNRDASILREDFCGTANSSCEWVRRRPTNIAYSVDIDADVQAWGSEHHVSKLSEEQQKRVNLLTADVMNSGSTANDVVLAMNFSYWIFKSRELMIQYFRSVYNSLNEDGIFILDSFGGYEAFREMEESTKHDGFTYIWDQSSYNPITGDGLFHIHFKFKDGSKLKQAFTYDWRVWTLPEITEMLREAGFKAEVYWEGTDEDGEGNGEFEATTTGEADAGWIAYIVATR
ncbi:MAG: class I SAM-dependent methyltransferase [Gammaproteobacteria bacterium]|nr:class I SAM-dependent methyltransferase [Gammaproteobacteria bacterium]